MAWDELIAAVIGGVIGAALRPYVERLLPAPARIRSVQLRVERAWSDHRPWEERNEAAMGRDFQRVDAEFAGRNIYGSGPWMQAREEVRQRYLDALQDHQRQTFRESEDALLALGPLERLWARFRLRKQRPVESSVESRIFRNGQ